MGLVLFPLVERVWQKLMVPCIAGTIVFGGQLEFPTPYATVCIGGYGNSDNSAVSKLTGIVPGVLTRR